MHDRTGLRDVKGNTTDGQTRTRSSRVIYEMGNLELIETSATIQCLSCLKHVPEGSNMCLRGVWLRPNQDTKNTVDIKHDAPHRQRIVMKT